MPSFETAIPCTVLNCCGPGTFVDARARRGVVRLVAVRSPVPLVGAGLGVEHNHAAISVPIRDEDFIGRSVHGNSGRLVDVFRIVAASGLAVSTDLQQKLSGLGEFQKVRVLLAVAGDPHVVFVVDEDAVLGIGPVVALPRTTPGLKEIPGLIEFQNRRRRSTAIGRFVAEILVVLVGGARTMDHPDVVVGIDGDAGNLSQNPVVGQMLGPIRIGFKLRQLGPAAPEARLNENSPATASILRVFSFMTTPLRFTVFDVLGAGRPLRVRVADAAEVLGVARILAEVLEHRHAGRPNPAVVGAHGELEQFECAVHFPERGTHHGQMQMLDVLGLRARFEFGESGPGLIDSSRAGQRPGVVAEIERRAAGELDARAKSRSASSCRPSRE